MFKKTFLLIVALSGLLFFKVSSVTAQTRDCKFSSPIEGGKPNGDFAFQATTPWEPSHTGEDFIYAPGTHVLAVDEGEVVFAGWWPPEGESSRFGYGPSVFIQHDCGVLSFYTHLDPSIPAVRTQKVERGQLIGLIGPKGIAPAGNVPHLHFGIRNGDSDPNLGYSGSGSWFDPKVFLNSAPVAKKTPLGGMRSSDALSTPITLPSIDEIWENITAIIPYGLGIILLIFVVKNGGYMISGFIYHSFWGTYKWNAWMLGATLAVPFSCIIFLLYPVINNLPEAPKNAMAAMSFEEKGTQYAAIYGRFRGWGTVGTLTSAEAIVKKAQENATLVSSWNKTPVKPVVILNIYGAGTSPEKPEFIKQVLAAAKGKIVVMLDIQPTPGQSLQELCTTAVSYVSSDQIWISIDPEYFKGQFEASWLNECADRYNAALQNGHGVIGLWEFRPGGAWLLKDPQNVTRRRSRSLILPMFDGFGSLSAKTAGLEQLKKSYGEPFGVAEWQSLYPDRYDRGFTPNSLLTKGPWILVRY
ncbi:MAG: M23 family metallopeptidase [Candidatus Gottesmanbacteria bacterium]|nr:M23 family metallopeptidase [Candidatus Gottesmanbacteria bacterium]